MLKLLAIGIIVIVTIAAIFSWPSKVDDDE